MIDGRKSWDSVLENIVKEAQLNSTTSVKWVWLHVSSLGEYEQALPLVEEILQNHKEYAVLTTFFSPSGYRHANKAIQGLYHMYIPWDYSGNATRFLETLSPELILFNKYDFWYNFLHTARDKDIPLILINAYFDKSHRILKSKKGSFWDIFSLFNKVFTQDNQSATLINRSNPGLAIHTGDTRVNRVIQLMQTQIDPAISHRMQAFPTPTFIAGSTWEPDEKILREFMDNYVYRDKQDLHLTIAPHEVNPKRIADLKGLFARYNPVLLSEKEKSEINSSVLIVDSIGILKHLYKYHDYAYIGGGFGDGVHSVLEPAIHYIPLFYGSNYRRSYHADKLVKIGGAYRIQGSRELLAAFAQAKTKKVTIGDIIRRYIESQENAVNNIYTGIKSYL